MTQVERLQYIKSHTKFSHCPCGFIFLPIDRQEDDCPQCSKKAELEILEMIIGDNDINYDIYDDYRFENVI